jgi:hypothetical protein
MPNRISSREIFVIEVCATRVRSDESLTSYFPASSSMSIFYAALTLGLFHARNLEDIRHNRDTIRAGLGRGVVMLLEYH